MSDTQVNDDIVTQEEIEFAVAVGAAWLDQHVPNWVNEIDLESLDLREQCACVLGQLVKTVQVDWPDEYVNYYTVAASSWQQRPHALEHEVFGLDHQLSHEQAINMGFHGRLYVDDPHGPDEWDALTDAWRRLILYRRA
jgi:hypothetical protein